MLRFILAFQDYYAEAVYEAPALRKSLLVKIIANESHFVYYHGDGTATIYTEQQVFRRHVRVNKYVCDVADNALRYFPRFLPDLSQFTRAPGAFLKHNKNCTLYQRTFGDSAQISQYNRLDELIHFNRFTYQRADFYCEQIGDLCVPVQYSIAGEDPGAFSVPHFGFHSYYFLSFDEDAAKHAMEMPAECVAELEALERDALYSRYASYYYIPDKKFESAPTQVYKPLQRRGHQNEQLDYRLRALFSPVQDQLACNASYAFALAGMIEARMNLRRSIQEGRAAVSVQSLLSCLFTDMQERDSNGCYDGNAHAAVKKFIFDLNGRVPHGLDDYIGHETECNWALWSKKSVFTSFYKVDSDIRAIKSELLSNGPVLARMATSAAYFEYAGGVFFDPKCHASDIHQEVLVIGFGTDAQAGDYWIVKNSLGPHWGIDGYMYLSMANNNCDILDEVYGIISGVSGSTIAAMVIFFTLLIAACALIVWFCLRRQNKNDDERYRLLYEDLGGASY